MKVSAFPVAPRQKAGRRSRWTIEVPFNPVRAIEGLRDLPIGARLVLPFPPAELSPNGRANRYAKARCAKAYRETCWALTIELFGCVTTPAFIPADGPIAVRLDFFPPNGARRDDDNCEAAFKWGRDGVAAALRFDDSRIAVRGRTLHPDTRGCVVMTFLGDET